MAKDNFLVEIDPKKLLKLVARTTRPRFHGGSSPVTERQKIDHDAAEDESMMSILERAIARAKKEEESVPCGLDVGQLAACTAEVERTCALRNAECCPRRQKRRALELRQELRKESAARGVPERVLLSAFDAQPRPTSAFLKVQDWLASERSLLVLSGTNQCGKTTAAGWAACCHPSFGGLKRRTRYLTAAEATIPDKGDELLRLLPTLDLLVLDDVGQAFFGASGFSLRQLEVLVDAVYLGNGRLIICTDIKLKDAATNTMPFIDVVGKRIASRILQAGRMEADLGPAFDARRFSP